MTTHRKSSKVTRKARRNGRARNLPLGDYEASDSLESKIVGLAIKGKIAQAAHKAIKEQRKSGLPIVFQRGKEIVRQHPDGRVEVLERIGDREYAVPKNVAVVTPK